MMDDSLISKHYNQVRGLKRSADLKEEGTTPAGMASQYTLISFPKSIWTFGVVILFMYACGIIIYIWSANYACRFKAVGEKPALALTSLKLDMEKRGQYIILKNYIRGLLQVPKQNSVTFVSAVTLLEFSHLPEICSRWQGPLSLSVYAPGSDFQRALRKILNLRLLNSCIHLNATWHLYFDAEFSPSTNLDFRSPEEEAGLEIPYYSYEQRMKGTFQSHSSIPFPANVGRNVAVQQSQTNYVLVTELFYPSSNIIPRFLKLLEFEKSVRNRVFVLPLFKLDWYSKSPETKTQLVEMISRGNIVLPSGMPDCAQCNVFPNARKWLEARSPEDTLSVYYISKDKDELASWQPYYISTRNIPLFDEDEIKEGKHDRKLQIFQLCLHLYEFHILDNAFLVQVPQQEKPMKDIRSIQKFIQQNNDARQRKIEQLLCRYGSDTGCSL